MRLHRRALAVALLGLVGLAPATTAQSSGPYCNQIAIVGDSVTAQGANALHAQFPKAIINARGQRRADQAWEAVAGIDGANTVDCWVFALGTNELYGWHDWSSDRATVLDVSKVVEANDHVWWILPQVAPSSGLSATVWNSAVPSYAGPVDLRTPLGDFQPDGVHLTPAGYTRRALAIATALGL